MKTSSKMLMAAAVAAGLGAVTVASAHMAGDAERTGMGQRGEHVQAGGHGMGMGMGMGRGMGGGHAMADGQGMGMRHGMGAGQGPGAQRGMGPTGSGPADRLGRLKGELKLTDGQQAAWNTFEKTVTEQAEVRRNMRENMRGQGNPAMHESMTAWHQKADADLAAARKGLADVLSPEQRATLDRQSGQSRPLAGAGPRGGQEGGHKH